MCSCSTWKRFTRNAQFPDERKPTLGKQEVRNWFKIPERTEIQIGSCIRGLFKTQEEVAEVSQTFHSLHELEQNWECRAPQMKGP